MSLSAYESQGQNLIVFLAEPCPELVSSEHFQTDEGLAKKTLYKLICARETELWKSDANAQALLQSAAEEVLKFHIEKKKNINSKKIPPQITRHAILCDIPIPDLKPDESQFHDPLPPENPILDYEPKVSNPRLVNPRSFDKKNEIQANETGNSFGHISSVSQHFLASFLPGMEQGGQEEGGIDIQHQVCYFMHSVIKKIILSRFEIWLHPCRIY